jgi:aspartyl-tRNA synthetase
MENSMNIEQRTHYCGELSKNNVGEKVVLLGWVRRQRDLGSLIFVDLRDRSGIVQLKFSEEKNPEEYFVGKKLRSEFVIGVEGEVFFRGEKDINPHLPTGEVEVLVSKIEVFSEAETPPFPIEDEAIVSEELRLEYRYLDLRRPFQNRRIQLRHKLTQTVREHLSREGFIEIETPFLTKSTPEGARDFLVPSRLRKGTFYALPQSPQLFKQLCMVAGFDKYFQVVRCFRDEDLRADRQPEFTQIDIEISFPTEKAIMEIAERLFLKIFKEFSFEVPLPIPKMSYKEAIERYGSDKPDTRFGMELKSVEHIVKDGNFGVFLNAIENGESVRAISIPEEGLISRKELSNLEEMVKPFGVKGVVAIQRIDGKPKGSQVKYLGEEVSNKLLDFMQVEEGGTALLVASPYLSASTALSQLRLYFGKLLKLYDPSKHSLLWIHKFPAFEWSMEESRWVSTHHPFTMIKEEDIPLLEKEPEKVESIAYDIVLDGNEIGGGSIRIHKTDLQRKIFKTLGFTEEEADKKFGFLLEAFKYGTPPHGGIAFGLDRLCMLILGCDSIRDVIPFPKTTSGLCLMTSSPSEVDSKQLKELKIKIEKE